MAPPTTTDRPARVEPDTVPAAPLTVLIADKFERSGIDSISEIGCRVHSHSLCQVGGRKKRPFGGVGQEFLHQPPIGGRQSAVILFDDLP